MKISIFLILLVMSCSLPGMEAQFDAKLKKNLLHAYHGLKNVSKSLAKTKEREAQEHCQQAKEMMRYSLSAFNLDPSIFKIECLDPLSDQLTDVDPEQKTIQINQDMCNPNCPTALYFTLYQAACLRDYEDQKSLFKKVLGPTIQVASSVVVGLASHLISEKIIRTLSTDQNSFFTTYSPAVIALGSTLLAQNTIYEKLASLKLSLNQRAELVCKKLIELEEFEEIANILTQFKLNFQNGFDYSKPDQHSEKDYTMKQEYKRLKKILEKEGYGVITPHEDDSLCSQTIIMKNGKVLASSALCIDINQ